MDPDQSTSTLSTSEKKSANRLNWRRGAKWFLAEFIVVVTGVLVALALNALYQGRLDSSREADYLTLLSRDLQAAEDDLHEHSNFEASQIADGNYVYWSLSNPALPRDTDSLSKAMAHLGTRRTLVPKNSTYEDLISTGNLTLIRNSALRNDLVAFYESMELRFEIINKNNSFFVDDSYNTNVIFSGLIMMKPYKGNIDRLTEVVSEMRVQMAGGYIEEEDLLWQLPESDPRWAMVKSLLLSRIRVASAGKAFADSLANDTKKLRAAIEREQSR